VLRDANIECPVDDEVEFVIHQLPELLQHKLIQDILLISGYFLGNRRPLDELARELGLAPAVAANKLAAFEAAAHALRDTRQPPHAD
jgi:hypothetical protein